MGQVTGCVGRSAEPDGAGHSCSEVQWGQQPDWADCYVLDVCKQRTEHARHVSSEWAVYRVASHRSGCACDKQKFPCCSCLIPPCVPHLRHQTIAATPFPLAPSIPRIYSGIST